MKNLYQEYDYRQAAAAIELKIEFNPDYGVDKGTGWSIVVNGSIVAELERYFYQGNSLLFLCLGKEISVNTTPRTAACPLE